MKATWAAIIHASSSVNPKPTYFAVTHVATMVSQIAIEEWMLPWLWAGATADSKKVSSLGPYVRFWL